MSILSVKNLDEKAFNYAVITVTPEAQVTLRGDSKNIRHLGCNRFQILLGATVLSGGGGVLISPHQLFHQMVMVLGHLLPTMLVRLMVVFISFIVLVALLVFLMTTIMTVDISLIMLSVLILCFCVLLSLLVNVMVPGISWLDI